MENYVYNYDSLSNSYNRSYVPTTRFTISSSVRVPFGEIDFRTGMLKPDHQRRRTQATRLEEEWNMRQQENILDTFKRETAKNGVCISMRAFILIVFTAIFVLGMMLLFQTGAIANLRNETTIIEETVEDYKAANNELLDSIAANSTETVIMTAARDRLGMVRRTEKDAIHLTAPETRPLETETIQITAGQTTPWVTSSALPGMPDGYMTSRN